MVINDSIRYLSGVGEKCASIFNKLNIFTILDLLEYFPIRYEDRREKKEIKDLEPYKMQSFLGKVFSIKTINIKPKMQITKVVVSDGNGYINLIWFNQSFREKQLKPNQVLAIYGKIEINRFGLSIHSPEFEIIDDDQDNSIFIITPVYRLTGEIKQKQIRFLISNTLKNTVLNSYLPMTIVRNEKLMDYKEALNYIHFPKNFDLLYKARYRLVFEEFFTLQTLIMQEREIYQQKRTKFILADKGKVKKLLAQFPFKLTNAQNFVWREIENDLNSSKPMKRLLQGDVGSGKTAIITMAILRTAENNYQSALMVPTEILAIQHYETINKYFLSLGIKCELLRRKIPKKRKNQIIEDIKNNKIKVVIGTHSLLQENVEFNSLSLVVTDEQHRFGIKQRSMLKAKGQNPHMLITTATPIPRTLALTIYGGLDISIINEIPPGRLKVKTFLRDRSKRDLIYTFAINEIKKGRQIYIVCPLVKESKKLRTISAVNLFYELTKTYFNKVKCVLMHSQLKQDEKIKIMNEFIKKQADVMITTTVIEVGVDIPNVSLIIIEGASRFGLAQLHQLRGRVGRSNYQSYCILIDDVNNYQTKERLNTFVNNTDGFFIAEEDLKIRKSGQFFGFKQHGVNDLKIGDLVSDCRIMLRVKNIFEQRNQNLIKEYIKKKFSTSNLPQILET